PPGRRAGGPARDHLRRRPAVPAPASGPERARAMTGTAREAAPAELKSCCANLYETDVARLLLGDSFHPGGLALTERLGQLLRLCPDDVVLDVAAGRGTSAVHLAKLFGCRV